MLVKGNQTTNIKKYGQFPMGLAFATSDHRGMYMDVDMRAETSLTDIKSPQGS